MDQFGICNKPMLANETDILEIFLDFKNLNSKELRLRMRCGLTRWLSVKNPAVYHYLALLSFFVCFTKC